jgi:hypothetical protein
LACTPLVSAGRQQCDFRAKEGVTIENAVPGFGIFDRPLWNDPRFGKLGPLHPELYG